MKNGEMHYYAHEIDGSQAPPVIVASGTPIHDSHYKSADVDMGVVRKYSLWQRFRARFIGSCFLEYRCPPGFKYPTKFYLTRCSEHGYYEDYEHGFRPDTFFDCPRCRGEKE